MLLETHNEIQNQEAQFVLSLQMCACEKFPHSIQTHQLKAHLSHPSSEYVVLNYKTIQYTPQQISLVIYTVLFPLMKKKNVSLQIQSPKILARIKTDSVVENRF